MHPAPATAPPEPLLTASAVDYVVVVLCLVAFVFMGSAVVPFWQTLSWVHIMRGPPSHHFWLAPDAAKRGVSWSRGHPQTRDGR